MIKYYHQNLNFLFDSNFIQKQLTGLLKNKEYQNIKNNVLLNSQLIFHQAYYLLNCPLPNL
jgi:hypothetical protein